MSAAIAELALSNDAGATQEIDFDALAGQLAHELLTPIGQIGAIAQLLLDGKAFAGDERSRAWLGLLIDASRLSDETVHALLDVARSRTAPLRCEAVDLSALCLQLLAETALLRNRGGMRSVVQPAMRVWAEPRLIRIVMRNLLANAVKYSRDVDCASISVGAAVSEPDAVAVEVSDNGAGFDPRHAGRLFQPFQRAHTQDQFAGCGLGLAMASRIVLRHGGEMHVATAPGLGTRVRFTLPAQPVQQGEA